MTYKNIFFGGDAKKEMLSATEVFSVGTFLNCLNFLVLRQSPQDLKYHFNSFTLVNYIAVEISGVDG